MEWKPLLRQLLVGSGTWALYFMYGLVSGAPTVVVPQLRKTNQTISDDLAAWIPATAVYGGIPWVILVSALTVSIGRKKAHIVVCISSTLGFIIFFFSLNVTHLLLSGLFLGALGASHLTNSIIILTEFTSPQHRGIFLTLKSATMFWGILAANIIGTFLPWQNIPTLGMICGAYTLVNAIFWPESPLWLASKGKNEECAKAHRWLKGESEESERELEKLLKAHEHVKFLKPYWSPRRTYGTVTQKIYYQPLLLIIMLMFLYCLCGKLLCSVFAVDVLKSVTKGESTAYSGMLILDGVTVLSMYAGALLARVLRRRVMMLSFCTLGIIFLILISLYLYLVQISILSNNIYISIALLTGYSISISVGPMIMCTTIIGELLPLECRCLATAIVALAFKLIVGTFMKLSPYFFRNLGMHGTFLLYAISSSILLIIIYFCVPETKDKTLQEIYDGFKDKEKRSEAEGAELMNIRNGNCTSS